MANLWDAQWTVTTSLVKDLIESQFPSLHPVQVSPFSFGWDNDVFLVNDEFIFRFPRRHVAVDLIHLEQIVLPQIAPNLPLPISSPTFYGRKSERFPFAFVGYRKLQGDPLHVRAKPLMNPSRLAHDLARFLRALHHLPLDHITGVQLPGDDIGRLHLEQRLPKYEAMVRQAADLPVNADQNVTSALFQLVDGLSTRRNLPDAHVVCHGDLNFRNFLVSHGGRVTGVIDWGDLHIGHPAVDLAIVYAVLPNALRTTFWDVYGPVDDMTKRVARFRAAYSLLNILLSAHDLGDDMQVQEALKELATVIQPDEPCSPQTN